MRQATGRWTLIHRLGGKSAAGDSLVSEASAGRMGLGGVDAGGISLCRTVLVAADARGEAPHGSLIPRVPPDDWHSNRGRLLGYRCLLYTSPSPRDRQKSR